MLQQKSMSNSDSSSSSPCVFSISTIDHCFEMNHCEFFEDASSSALHSKIQANSLTHHNQKEMVTFLILATIGFTIIFQYFLQDKDSVVLQSVMLAVVEQN